MTDDTLAALRRDVEELKDRVKIQETIYRYCRGIDRLDEAMFGSAFWPDGRFPEGPPRETADKLVPSYMRGRSREIFQSTHHMMGNIIIELAGDKAYTETYALVNHRSWPNRESNLQVMGEEYLSRDGVDPEVSHSLIIGFRYVDQFQKRGDEWKIAERRLVFDWNHALPYSGILDGGLYTGTRLRGQRDKSDSIYRSRATGTSSL